MLLVASKYDNSLVKFNALTGSPLGVYSTGVQLPNDLVVGPGTPVSAPTGGGSSPSPPAWGSLVTISNCASATCGAGSMTRTKDGRAWNHRVWDNQKCCHNCACTAARWKVPFTGGWDFVYCGFSAWNAAGSTNAGGNHKFSSYGLYVTGGGALLCQGGPRW